MILSIDSEKSLSGIQHLFITKTLSKVGIEGNFLHLIKVSEKPMANI